MIITTSNTIKQKLLPDKKVEFVNTHLTHFHDMAGEYPNYVGTPAIIVNLASAEIFVKFFSEFWPEAIVINEVYLGNHAKILADLSKIGCQYYQLAGVDGFSFPRLPKPYSHSIPCCAAWLDSKMQAVILKLI